jgi:hypothetical protein
MKHSTLSGLVRFSSIFPSVKFKNGMKLGFVVWHSFKEEFVRQNPITRVNRTK